MKNQLNTRQEIIDALVTMWDENPNSFNYNKTAIKFWTYNRLLKYYKELNTDWVKTPHGRTRVKLNGKPISKKTEQKNMKNLQTFEDFVNEERIYGLFNDDQGKPSKISDLDSRNNMR